MHDAAYAYVAWAVRSYKVARQPVLEIGSKNINGSIRPLFSGKFLGIDRSPGRDVDIVADGSTFVPDFRPATVVCCEVLEHCETAAVLCENVFNILPGGGLFIVTAAGDGRIPHSGVDGGPLRSNEFYENVSEAMLKHWLEKFKILTYESDGGDIRAVAQKE